AVHAQGEDLKELAEFASANKFAHALDLGCGGGHASFAVAPHVGEITAYDLSAEMLSAVAQEAGNRGLSNLKTQQGTVEKLPFPDASFDFVVTRFSAHHWHDIRAGLREARRVAKKGAAAMFMDAVPPPNPLLDTFIQTIEMLRDLDRAHADAARLCQRHSRASEGYERGRRQTFRHRVGWQLHARCDEHEG